MSLKEQLVRILEQSKETESAFIASLSEKQHSAEGRFEEWCAKDNVAHFAYWKGERAAYLAALARGDEPPAGPPNYEQANRACFERYCECSWEKVQAFADQAHAALAEAVRALNEESLAAPHPGPLDRPLWHQVVGTAYSHPLIHMAEYYTGHGKQEKAGQLWPRWGELVSPLDRSPDWQGLVHYNKACGLALSGNPDQALAELRLALEMRPSLTTWSKQDPDLATLSDMPEFRELYAPAYWWAAVDTGPLAEAMADQFMRSFGMLRLAVEAFSAEEWRKGDTPYQRPAGLALHALESAHGYSELEPGEVDAGLAVSWEEKDASKLPTQEEMLAYLEKVEQSVARFLAEADLTAPEEHARWTGATLLSKAAYMLRHTQHHLAEMCLELHRRGIQAPDWQ